jgi:hypothetical protein
MQDWRRWNLAGKPDEHKEKTGDQKVASFLVAAKDACQPAGMIK